MRWPLRPIFNPRLSTLSLCTFWLHGPRTLIFVHPRLIMNHKLLVEHRPPPPPAEALHCLSTRTRSDCRFSDHSFYGQKLNRT